jgi:hypothetical protein
MPGREAEVLVQGSGGCPASACRRRSRLSRRLLAQAPRQTSSLLKLVLGRSAHRMCARHGPAQVLDAYNGPHYNEAYDTVIPRCRNGRHL